MDSQADHEADQEAGNTAPDGNFDGGSFGGWRFGVDMSQVTISSRVCDGSIRLEACYDF
jgi:hypothetical protein